MTSGLSALWNRQDYAAQRADEIVNHAVSGHDNAKRHPAHERSRESCRLAAQR
jgi:hypothetical protein